MSIINFAIPKTLEKRVAQVIKQKGFASKAEFFRFAAMYLVDIIDKPIVNEEERFAYLVNALSREIFDKYHSKSLPSLNKQLADIPE